MGSKVSLFVGNRCWQISWADGGDCGVMENPGFPQGWDGSEEKQRKMGNFQVIPWKFGNIGVSAGF